MTTKPRIPLDQLPELGDWDGPIHGQLGVLAIDGDKAQCHCCGLHFTYLANHVWRRHELYADEYRAIFGLRRHTGLVGPTLRERHRQIGIRSFSPYWDRGPELSRAQTPEQKAAWGRAKRVALESRLDPKNQAAWAENVGRAQARVREMQASGTWHAPQAPPGNMEKATARWRELMVDPEYRAKHARKVSEAKGGRVTVGCATCGAPVAIPHHKAAEGRRRFCSRDCFREYLRVSMRGTASSRARAIRLRRKACRMCGALFEGLPRRLYCGPDCARRAENARRREKTQRANTTRTESERAGRASRLSAALSQAIRLQQHPDYRRIELQLRALPEAAFELLGPRERQMVRLYYGLIDGVPRTLAEVGTQVGLRPPWASTLISRSVSRLLQLWSAV